MGKYTRAANIIAGADTASGANRARALGGASRRATEMGDVLFDVAAPVLMQPDVLASLPADLAARIKLGDADAVMEGYLEVMSSGRVPQNIPRDTQIARNNFPDASAGFQVGAYGGGVPYDSAGELAVAGSRSLSRNPGAEAGFAWDGNAGPQAFDSTSLSVPGRGEIRVRQAPRSSERGGSKWPWVGAGAGVAAGGRLLYDSLGSGEGDVQVKPEESLPGTSEEGTLPAVDQQMSELQSQASAIVDRMMGNLPPANAASRRKPPRPESELWQTQGERSMEYELRPGTPQANTRDVLLDAGIEPGRAEGIARGIISMTEQERSAVVGNGPARSRRTQDQIEERRAARMGSY